MLPFICSLLCCCSTLQAEDAKLKVIVDTDCDMDDMMAILYLLKRKDVEVLAITTTGTGAAHWKYSAPNILKLIELAGHPDIPVAFGAKISLSPYSSFPESWREGFDEVYGIPLPTNPHHASSLPSWELMAQTVEQSADKITILCLAPMTNVAIALEKRPQMLKNIERIYISGGSIDKKGNIVDSDNTCAEYNILLDARAAQDVIASGAPIVLVPLNATESAQITPEVIEQFQSQKNNPSANFVFEVIKPYLKAQPGVKAYFWDPEAAAVMTNPEIGTFKDLKIVVNQEPGPQYGCTEINEDGSLTNVCLSIDAEKFYQLFFDTINQ